MKLQSYHFLLLGLGMLAVIFAYKGVIDARDAIKNYAPMSMHTPSEINQAVGAK